jgi:hypothetical protein
MDADNWQRLMDIDGDTVEFDVERATIEEGRTMSADAVSLTASAVAVFIATRIAQRWDATNEPPTAVHVTVTVDVH